MIKKNYYRVYYYPAHSVVIEAFDEGEALDIAMETPLTEFTYNSDMDEYTVEEDEDTDEDEYDDEDDDDDEYDDENYDPEGIMGEGEFDDDLGEDDYDAGH
jgi:hypothetical protein